MNDEQNTYYSSGPETDFIPENEIEEPPVRHPKRWSPSMASASLVLSVMAVISMYFSIPLSSLALVLAMLSRGSRRPTRKHRFAIILSGGALFASLIMTGYGIYQFASSPELRAQYASYVRYLTGQDLSELFPGAFSEIDSTRNDPETNEAVTETQTEAPRTASEELLDRFLKSRETERSHDYSPLTPLPGRHAMPQNA